MKGDDGRGRAHISKNTDDSLPDAWTSSIARAGLDADRPALGLPRLPLTEQLLTAATPSRRLASTALPRVIASSSVTIPFPRGPNASLAGLRALWWCVVFAVLRFGGSFRNNAALVTERDAAVEGSRFGGGTSATLHYVMEPPSTRKRIVACAMGGDRCWHFAHGFGANALTGILLPSSVRPCARRSDACRLAAAHDRLGLAPPAAEAS